MNIKFSLILLPVFAVGCALAQIPANSVNLKTAAANYTANPTPILGGGYSSDMQTPTGLECLEDGTIKFEGDTKSVIQLGDKKSFDEIQKDLSVDVSASTSIGQFSGDMNASYARHIKSDTYSEAFYYLENITLPTKIFMPATFGEKALNDFGKMAYSAGPDQFRLSCGDKFLQQTPMGANLFVTLKLNFSSLSDKETFAAHADASFGSIASASADLQRIVSQYHIKGELEVSAYQEGGNPSHLANIFTKDKDHYYVTECALNNLNACQSTIAGVINYAQTDFENQIDFKDGKILGSAAPTDYSYMIYTKIGLKTGDTTVTPEILKARETVGDIYQDITKKSTFVDHVLNSGIIAPYLTKDWQDGLSKASNSLHKDLNYLNNT